jgi:hypothetical protein
LRGKDAKGQGFEEADRADRGETVNMKESTPILF